MKLPWGLACPVSRTCWGLGLFDFFFYSKSSEIWKESLWEEVFKIVGGGCARRFDQNSRKYLDLFYLRSSLQREAASWTKRWRSGWSCLSKAKSATGSGKFLGICPTNSDHVMPYQSVCFCLRSTYDFFFVCSLASQNPKTIIKKKMSVCMSVCPIFLVCGSISGCLIASNFHIWLI